MYSSKGDHDKYSPKDATRVTKDTSTLIDHIYVSNLDKVQESHVCKLAISDHYPICLTRKEVNKDKKNSHSTITYRNFKKFDQNEFLLDLQSTPFYKIEFEDNPSVCLQLFYDMLNKVLDKHAPVVEKRVKKDRQPDWYNSEIIYARNMRDKYNALGLWSEYRFWRNKTKQIIENSKKNYYKNMVKDSKDSKSLWKCLHSLNPKFKKSPHELATDENNTTTNDKKSIADTFNTFFTSCAEELREQRDITSIDKADFNNLSKFIKNQLKQQKHEKFTIPPIKINELFDELIKLDVNKSSGTDNIGPQILKISAPCIASPLTYIFNRMIDTGIYPSLLKNAKVTPVYKDGDKVLATNYRPISVLPSLSKVLERHVSNNMYKYLSKFKLLHPTQSDPSRSPLPYGKDLPFLEPLVELV
ncbi:unnamed protein product [Mytilus edulis]|uniref:RNA-directed DNA polymerase from mobile element jockey-like n=1 Tax=Mytilus edulis TaxID=6550 RepID=A0A8S3PPZ7_MYTED|nr:unnamed protein product [Mytilus edulis]